MKASALLSAAVLLAGSSVSYAAAILRITEAMSASTTDPDWFELTNLGDTAIDITGYKMDDSSFNISTAVALSGITSIAPGESVIFLEDDGTGIADFKTEWNLTSLQVGNYLGSGVGLSGPNGDGVGLFDALNNLLTQVSFGVATSGTSFQWVYDSTGVLFSGPTLSTTASTGTNGAFGTPGSVIPEPSFVLLSALAALVPLRRRR